MLIEKNGGTESCLRLLSGEPNYNGCFEFNR
jgi:hypothetical protein